jgi:hypothetical protein
MGQGSEPLGDRPEAIELLSVHRLAVERGHDLHAVASAVAVRVFPELRVAGPLPGGLDRPSVPHVLQQRLGRGSGSRDVVSGFHRGLAPAGALAVHCQDPGAAGPVFHHPRCCRHAPQRPAQVTGACARDGSIHTAPCGHKSADRGLAEIPCGYCVSSQSGRRHRPVLGRGKRAVCMQLVRLHQQAAEPHMIDELTQGADLTSLIGGVGALGDRHS